MRRSTLAALVVLVAGAAPAPTASAETVRVFAAASLTEAFRETAGLFEKQHPGDTVELSFAGSQVLRAQIEQGAPADVFASADRVHAEALRAAGLLGPYTIFARNKLVLVVPAGSTKVTRLQDVARPGVKVLVAGPTVPVGRYTTQALVKLGASQLYGDDFQSRVQANVVSQETNVRAVLAKVALGEADAGFVYVTDAATAAQKLQVIDVPDRYNVVAECPIGLVTKGAAATQARAFVDLVLGPEGQAILRKHGFSR